jgi:hypothetical protein
MNLEGGLMEQKGFPTVWFSLSAADNYWLLLYFLAINDALAAQYRELYGELDELAKAKMRRKWVRENPHIVDYYFHIRMREFIKALFGKDCLNCEWYWLRTEYQHRGCAHIHGCSRLKSDPNLHELAQKIVHGREAQLAWIASGDPYPLPEPHFTARDMEEDKIVRVFESNVALSDEDIDSLTLKILESRGPASVAQLSRFHSVNCPPVASFGCQRRCSG